jgi:hypothetical protein
MKCPEYTRLESEVTAVLQKLSELTKQQLDLFRNGDQGAFMRLDKELENTVGHKERAVGALRQHAKEHACHPGMAS